MLGEIPQLNAEVKRKQIKKYNKIKKKNKFKRKLNFLKIIFFFLIIQKKINFLITK
jgi:hypothetical protein